MQRIIDSTAVASLPAVPALTGTLGYFTEGAPGTQAATLLRAWWVNMMQEEMMSLLTAAGISPDTAGTNFTQILTAIRAFKNIQIFTSAGTFIVPTGVTRLDVEIWGGGGGSGGVAGNVSGITSNGGGSGSGGGYSRKIITGLVPGASIGVTIGAGGNASVGGTGLATAGSTSSFGSYISATGGSYGSNGTSAGPGAAVGGPGVGIGGDINITGGQGGNSWQSGSANTITVSAPGCSAFMPMSHPINGDNPGIAATMPGCAGTAATTASGNTSSGGAGFRGLCNVRW